MRMGYPTYSYGGQKLVRSQCPQKIPFLRMWLPIARHFRGPENPLAEAIDAIKVLYLSYLLLYGADPPFKSMPDF